MDVLEKKKKKAIAQTETKQNLKKYSDFKYFLHPNSKKLPGQ